MIGGLGMQELLIVLIVAMFLFGGKKLPEIGQNLGKAIRGFKQGSEGKEEKAEEKAIDETAPSKNSSSESEDPGVKEEAKEEAEVKKEETAQPPAAEEPKDPEAGSPGEKPEDIISD